MARLFPVTNHYYAEQILPRWTGYPVAFPTLDAAMQIARYWAASGDCASVKVWDCSADPAGRLVTEIFRNA